VRPALPRQRLEACGTRGEGDALAFNDIAFVQSRFLQDSAPAHEYLYFFRVAFAHFNEAARFLDSTSDVRAVAEYVQALPKAVRDDYDDCLHRYRGRESFVARVRNLSAFHYPELKLVPGQKKPRLMQQVLTGLTNERGSIFKAASGTIGDSRMLFADAIVTRLAGPGAQGHQDLLDAHADIAHAIQSFMRFANAALDEWWVRADTRGALQNEPGRPPWFGVG
jgi:hypothetical protein